MTCQYFIATSLDDRAVDPGEKIDQKQRHHADETGLDDAARQGPFLTRRLVQAIDVGEADDEIEEIDEELLNCIPREEEDDGRLEDENKAEVLEEETAGEKDEEGLIITGGAHAARVYTRSQK